MPDATLTSKGQITVPKPIRDALGVHAGDRLRFELRDDGVVELSRPRRRDLMSLAGMLASDVHTTLEEMDEAIAQAILDEDQRSR